MQVTCRCGNDLDIVNVSLDSGFDMDVMVEACEGCETEHNDEIDEVIDRADALKVELAEARGRITELEAQNKQYLFEGFRHFRD